MRENRRQSFSETFDSHEMRKDDVFDNQSPQETSSPQEVLTECQTFFQSLDCNSNDDHVVDRITAYLHDTWSVVRNECYKRLCKTLALLSGSVHRHLYHSLMSSCSNKSSWQQIHGSLLGLDALSDCLDPDCLEQIELICLDLIGHVNYPVRDACKSCLLRIQLKLNRRQEFICKLVRLIKKMLVNSELSDRMSENEASLSLDCMLGFLVDNYEELTPDLILHMNDEGSTAGRGSINRVRSYSTITHTLDSTSAHAGGEGSVGFFETMKLCMMHSASTVRQRAGQVLSTIMLAIVREGGLLLPPTPSTLPSLVATSLMSPYHLPSPCPSPSSSASRFLLVQLIVSKVLCDSLQDESVFVRWRSQEVAVIVAEELLRAMLAQYLAEVMSLYCYCNFKKLS